MTDPRTIWAADDAHSPPLDPAVLRRRAAAFERRVARRNAIEYLAALMLLPVFGWIGWRSGDLPMRVACGAIILGIVVVALNLRRYRARSVPDRFDAPVHGFLRAELVRQRDALHNVWRWYLAPLVPGLLLFFAAVFHAMPATVPIGARLARIAVAILIATAAFGGIHLLNRMAARRLDRAIADLDAFDQEN